MEMQPEFKKFAKRLNDILYEKQLTASEVAHCSGISEASLSKYRNGQRMPQGQNLRTLANALNVTVDYLVSDPDEKPKLFVKPNPIYEDKTGISKTGISKTRYADLKAAQNIVKNLSKMDIESLHLLLYLSDRLATAGKDNSDLIDSIYNALELVIPQDEE